VAEKNAELARFGHDDFPNNEIYTLYGRNILHTIYIRVIAGQQIRTILLENIGGTT
jgi:hypothetical protein